MCNYFSFCSLGSFPLQLSPSVLWYCWLGLLTCKNRLPYNLYRVGGDVKHCTVNQSIHCILRYNVVMYKTTSRLVNQFIRIAADNAGELQTIKTRKINKTHTHTQVGLHICIYKLIHMLQLNGLEWGLTHNLYSKKQLISTRKLCYRKDDRAMRAI